MVGMESKAHLGVNRGQKFDMSRHHDTCVIVHIYYPGMWNEIYSCLLNLRGDFDLYVTIPFEVNISDDDIRMKFPDAYIYRCENRGRDVAPFLEVFSVISKLNYKYVCKIHTKKSPHIINGSKWHRDMLSKLLGSPEIISQIKKNLDEHPDWGLVAPSGHVVPSSYFWTRNAGNVIRLMRSAGIPTNASEFSFVAGSMFWFKPQAFRLLLRVNVSTEDFDIEQGQQDGTLAHAFERFFGIAAMYDGYKIVESSEHGIRLTEIPFHFRLLLEEFQRMEQETRALSEYVARNERRLKKMFGSKIWSVIKFFRKCRP